ncbi:hypothetical protein SEA_NICHOLAS_29 [Mycobacterium phage Nicholas]|uniref:holin n=1 Tax=Mycobacterium phage Snenia TaxID=1698714 RepID=UPI0006CE3DA0|nr:holin [Mycobacterium phage Snenia]ASM62767.1 hypothetical protein SEA_CLAUTASTROPHE_29 [Mycobacterium phage Clautastrophe]ASR86959.1 hypothetical protein SEA_KINGSOLOMON_29 [Mycobacterium phage Kingsolomon]ASR87301.1 hypothetical protein SEA_NICHOLAS_29 [Mycobacterium phage Nicholas]AYB70384.1 hypothetical protein SEA_SAMTY_29 [Mycobacterium phage Samty]QDF16614.1 hypothetical protein PBI_MSGREEN_29 [Mycobacterium phage MsGreen]QDK03562.1 hypothetical protein SEA_FINNRY_29 [Mycobacterium p
MLVYDEQLPLLDDSFEGNEVNLLAVRGRKVDPHFRRNYAWAKHAIDRGALRKVVVIVALGSDSWVHTVGAVTSALSGQKLHQGARFKVDAEVSDIGTDKVTQVLAALKELEGPKDVYVLNTPKALATKQAKAPKPKPEPEPEQPVEDTPPVSES